LSLLNSIDLTGTNRQVNVNASVSSINGVLSSSTGTAGLTKGGAGTLYLNGANTYTGLTDVTNGTLGGLGSLAGPLTIESSATFSPGTSIGTFTVNNSVTLLGTTLMEINRTNALNADHLTASSIACGGVLTVANLGPALQAGDTFQLFSGSISGAFAITNLPALSDPNLYWDTSALGSGTLKVASNYVAPPAPTILPVYVDGSGNLVLRTATVAGHNYILLSTPSLEGTPVWTQVSTNAGTGGTITLTVPVSLTQPREFFRLDAQ
jgi:autotransporter-associated beta strand protein